MVTPDHLNEICARLDSLARDLQAGRASQAMAAAKCRVIAKEIRDADNPEVSNVVSLEERMK